MKLSVKDKVNDLKETLYLANININADVDVEVLPNLDLSKLNLLRFIEGKGETINE